MWVYIDDKKESKDEEQSDDEVMNIKLVAFGQPLHKNHHLNQGVSFQM